MCYSPIQQPILNFPFIFQISIMEYTTTQHRSPQSELFDLLDRLQSARLDDQRCELPNFNNGSGKNSSQNSQGGGAGSNNSDSRQSASKLMLQRILKHPPPYPTVALVNQGSHWIEPNVDPTAVNSNKPNQLKVMCRNSARVDSAEESARLYRVHFAGYEHFNFCANDIERGGQPLVLSIKVSDPADSCTNGTNDVIHGGLDCIRTRVLVVLCFAHGRLGSCALVDLQNYKITVVLVVKE